MISLKPIVLLSWSLNTANYFIFRFPFESQLTQTLYCVHQHLTLKQFRESINLKQQQMILSEGLTGNQTFIDFLVNQKSPKQITFHLTDKQQFLLQNQASDNQNQLITKIINSTDSIFYYLQRDLRIRQQQNVEFKYNTTKKINLFLNQFYIKLAAQTYCKLQKIHPNTILTQQLVQQFYNYIIKQHQLFPSVQLKKIQQIQNALKQNIAQLERQLAELQKYFVQKINVYRFGTIFFIGTHMLSFAFWTLFGNAVNWDMVEPLTYSIGTIYALFAIRFYQKYKTDLQTLNLRQILPKLVMSKQKYQFLQILKQKHSQLLKALHQANLSQKVYRNRTSFESALYTSLNQDTTLLTLNYHDQ